MRTFANLFLILFLADGTVSLLDEICSLLLPLSPLAGIRANLAGIVLLLALALYVALGVDRRLPKKLFLPQLALLFLSPLLPWMVPSLTGSHVFGMLAAILQIALGLLSLVLHRKQGSAGLLLPEGMFAPPVFTSTNTLVFIGVNLVVTPLALVLLLLSGANSFLAEQTSGFARLAPDGLHMTERVYRRNRQTIRLAGMIHVGEKTYYDDLVRPVATGRTIVLAEGVSDRDNLLQSRFDYGKVAGFLGLTPQEKMLFPGRLIAEDDLAALPEQGNNEAAGKTSGRGKTDILRADLDLNAFRPVTIRFLDALGKQMLNNASLMAGVRAFNTWAEKNLTPETQDVILEDIIERRNDEVIRCLGLALDRYDTVIIPWGALHLKAIEEEVLARGFTLQEERERTSISFGKLVRHICFSPPRDAGKPPPP
jgi:hypothetical protein